METFYLHKYQLKSDKELLDIVENKHLFQLEAVNAAIKLLNERNNTSIPETGKPIKITYEINEPPIFIPGCIV